MRPLVYTLPVTRLRTSPHTGLPAGKAVEDPLLSGKSSDSDSSGLGLSDLVEHWQKLDHFRQLAQGSLPASGLAEGATA